MSGAYGRFRFVVNGSPAEVVCPPTKPLLDVLRDDLGLTGSKECCGKGECGSCSVLLDGEVVCSCLVMVAQAEGADLLTVEGVAGADALHPVQQALIDEGGTQCGYCTPGFVVAAKALLDSLGGRRPTPAEIREAVAGNLCRCTGYTKIFRAIERAAEVVASRAR